MNKKTETVLEVASRVNGLLTDYIDVNNHIFKPSIRKVIPIPGLFQKINYHSSFLKLKDIEYELATVQSDLIVLFKDFDEFTSEYKFINVFIEYCEALLKTVISLKLICYKMKEKIDGNSKYDYSDYDIDVEEYNSHVKNYLSYGALVNQYHKEIIIKNC